MPWSFSTQRSAAVSAQADEEAALVCSSSAPSWSASRWAAPSSSPYTSIWRLVPRAVADPDRSAVAPALEVRQLALGEVVLAADAEHDLQRLARPDADEAAAVVMNAKKSSASSGQAATHSASMVKLASRTQE